MRKEIIFSDNLACGQMGEALFKVFLGMDLDHLSLCGGCEIIFA